MHKVPALLLLLFSPALFAQTLGMPFVPPPPIEAQAYVLLDYDSGQILVHKNENEHRAPASLTKLMAAYLTFSALKHGTLKMDQVVPVSVAAWRQGGSRMFIQPNLPVTVSQLLRGMIVESGNDATVALAQAVAGSRAVFVQMMNREAKRLGMTNTHYSDVNGLPVPDHYSTAHDLAILTRDLIQKFPEYYSIFKIQSFTYNHITQPNRIDPLIAVDPSVDGLKTGFTDAAGYCMIASAKRGSRRLISVVLGAASENARVVQSQRLLNYGFHFYDTVKLYGKDQPVTNLRIWKGTVDKLKAGLLSPLYLSVPKGQKDKLKATIVTRRPLLAPVKEGQQVGTLKLTLAGKPFRELPIVALQNVGLAGIFGRGWDTIRLMFK